MTIKDYNPNSENKGDQDLENGIRVEEQDTSGLSFKTSSLAADLINQFDLPNNYESPSTELGTASNFMSSAGPAVVGTTHQISPSPAVYSSSESQISAHLEGDHNQNGSIPEPSGRTIDSRRRFMIFLSIVVAIIIIVPSLF